MPARCSRRLTAYRPRAAQVDAIELAGADEARAAVARLSDAGVQLSATRAPGAVGPVHALRLGTQELVRRGLTVDDMVQVADLLAAALLRGRPAPELRRVAQQLASGV